MFKLKREETMNRKIDQFAKDVYMPKMQKESHQDFAINKHVIEKMRAEKKH